MALRKFVEFKGIPVPNAYIRVVGVTIHQGNTSMEFGVQYLATPESQPFTSVAYTSPYNLEGGNPVEQGYAHIKGLPEFEGAADC